MLARVAGHCRNAAFSSNVSAFRTNVPQVGVLDKRVTLKACVQVSVLIILSGCSRSASAGAQLQHGHQACGAAATARGACCLA